MEAFVPGGAGAAAAAVAAVGGFVAVAALAERAGVIAPRKRPNAPPGQPPPPPPAPHLSISLSLTHCHCLMECRLGEWWGLALTIGGEG